jgi:uncharacterized membrane protein
MFKKYLIPGLLIWLPLAITLWILDIILATLDRTLVLLPASWHPDSIFGFHVPGFGLILSVAIVLTTGALARNFVGNRLLQWWEGLLARIPIVRSIYASVKQVSDTMLSPKGNAFRKVVLVQFPQPGQWTLGFIVGEPSAPIERKLGPGYVTVYVPTAPNPTSGYVLLMAEADVKDADISVDDALKFHISLGVVGPGGKP